MEELKEKLKVYCEMSFWSYLNGGRATLPHIAVKQAATLRWWQDFAPSCEIFVSDFVGREVRCGNPEFAALRRKSIAAAKYLDGMIPQVEKLAVALMLGHAVPETETTDASHIAVAAVYGMDVLLTWNCRHMANPMTLPKTAKIITDANLRCPIIITPMEFIEHREELFHVY